MTDKIVSADIELYQTLKYIADNGSEFTSLGKVVMCVTALAEFTAARGEPESIRLLLAGLCAELINALEGRSSKIAYDIEQSRKKGRPRASFQSEHYFAIASVYVDEMGGRDVACKEVERRFRMAGLPLPEGSRYRAAGESIKDWRKKARSNRHRNNPDIAKAFEGAKDLLNQFLATGLTRVQAAETMLDVVIKQAKIRENNSQRR
ncbi:MAG: hypothetical protein KF874_13525 [Rhizobiaceae bacterium]|nr:hypothetical protein [Rhizobiaceae bacterium]